MIGTTIGDCEYPLIRLQDSTEHHQTVNKWIDQAIKDKKLLVINTDDYTNIHTKKRPLNEVSRASKMCTILPKKYDTEAVKLDNSTLVSNPDGILIDDLMRNLSSNKQVTNVYFCTFVQCCHADAPWLSKSCIEPLYKDTWTEHMVMQLMQQ